MAFLEQDGNAEIYMDWEDLDCLTENEIDSIKSNYPQSAHRYIFHRLFLAERSNSYLKAGPEQQTRIKERAINGAIKRWLSEVSTKCEFITLVNDTFSNGSFGKPIDSEVYTTLVEQQTLDSVVLVSLDLYMSDWFQNKLDKSRMYEVRVYMANSKNKHNEDEILRNLKENESAYYNHIEMIKQPSNQEPHKMIVIGDSTLYRKLYERMTDLFIVFTDIRELEDENCYFTELQLSSLDLVECQTFHEKMEVNDDVIEVELKPSYLRRLKGRGLKWKESPFDKTLLLR